MDSTEAVSEFDYEDTLARTLADYPGYAFTADGRAISLKRKQIHPLRHGLTGAGYCYVNIGCPPFKPSQLLHRLVARAFIPNPEDKPQVNHIDGSPANNVIDNLEWVTLAENMQHASALRRRQGRGVRRVTREQHHQMAELHLNGQTVATIAKATGLPYDTARRFIRRRHRCSSVQQAS